MADRAGYTMTAQVKIIRRKHKVAFHVGQRAEDFRANLKHVPNNATVDEVIDEVDGNGLATIEFHEEIVEK